LWPNLLRKKQNKKKKKGKKTLVMSSETEGVTSRNKKRWRDRDTCGGEGGEFKQRASVGGNKEGRIGDLPVVGGGHVKRKQKKKKNSWEERHRKKGNCCRKLGLGGGERKENLKEYSHKSPEKKTIIARDLGLRHLIWGGRIGEEKAGGGIGLRNYGGRRRKIKREKRV